MPIYRYYGGGTERNLIERTGSPVVVVRELGDSERDPEAGRMFRVRFEDGHEADAFEEELDTSADGLLALSQRYREALERIAEGPGTNSEHRERARNALGRDFES